MTNKEPWWKKHTTFKSDPILQMIEDSPEKFMVSRTEILQLVLDFKTLKNKFINLCYWHEASEQVRDEWDALSEEEKAKRKEESKKIEEELRKIFDS